MIKKLSAKDLNAICLILGSIFSFIPFFIQLLYNDMPVDGEHIFTYFANQIILNGNISLLNSMLSIFGATLIGYGIFGLSKDLQKDHPDNLINFALFLFLIATIGFIISWSQDFAIIWGDATLAPSQMMIEFSLTFSFGLLYWTGLAIFSYRISNLNFLDSNFLISFSIISSINVFLVIFTLFTIDVYAVSSLILLYLGFFIGNTILYIFCILAARKILPTK